MPQFPRLSLLHPLNPKPYLNPEKPTFLLDAWLQVVGVLVVVVVVVVVVAGGVIVAC